MMQMEQLQYLLNEKMELEGSEINTSQIDDNLYKYVELPNKLKVLLIQDPNTYMSSAALNVHAGSWQDPHDYAGLAHFLEHMLF